MSPVNKPVNVGIVGLGTVGGGARNLLRENAAELSRRTGRDIVVSHVGVRRARPDLKLDGITVSTDIFAVVRDPAVDIVVEVIGGTTTARDIVLQAMSGLMEATGSPDGPPTLVGEAVSDVVSGLFASWGVLAALLVRHALQSV